MLAARNKALFAKSDKEPRSNNFNVNRRLKELGYKDMVLIGSELMHYSFKKAISLLGLGVENIIHVENDAHGVMSTKNLQSIIDKCKEEKLLILALVGIAGSTERGSIDPLNEIGTIAKKNNYSFPCRCRLGWSFDFFRCTQHLIDGVKNADSITVCGHKHYFSHKELASVCSIIQII